MITVKIYGRELCSSIERASSLRGLPVEEYVISTLEEQAEFDIFDSFISILHSGYYEE